MSLEFNKIAAAVLMAGIIAMFSGFVARLLFHVEPLHQNAYSIAGVGEPTAPVGGTPAAPEAILGLIASADADKGAQLFKSACTTCHTIDQGGANKVGPNLYGVVGRDVAAHEGYAYSAAMKAHEGTWTYQELSAFLTAPAKHLPGTKMTYAGLKKVQDRADMIAYLRNQAATPVPLPTPEEIDAETKAAAGPSEVTPAEDPGAAGGTTAESATETAEPAASGSEPAVPSAEQTAQSTEPTTEPTTEPAATDGASQLEQQIAAADPAVGERLARQCATCHSFEKGGPNKVGPNLYGVVGAPFAQVEGFNYSKVFQEARAAGRTWSYEELAGYLANPKKYLPGNKMTFAGLKKEGDLVAIIAYLRQHHDNPPPLD